MLTVAGVYRITNTITGGCYIGSAINIVGRWRAHRHALRHHKKSPPKLQNAWDKYGEGAFVFEVLLICAKANTLMFEQRAIDALEPQYNVRKVAASNLGVRWSAETNSRKGRPITVVDFSGVTSALTNIIRQFAVVSHPTVRSRLAKGWSLEDALLTPPTPRQEIGRRASQTHKRNGTHPAMRVETVRGVTAPLHRLIAQFAVVTERSVRKRLHDGWALDDALFKPKVSGADKIQAAQAARRKHVD